MDFDALMKAYQQGGGGGGGGSSGTSSSSTGFRRPKRPSSDAVYVETVREQPKRVYHRKSKILVLVCAGPGSLHDTWFKKEELAEDSTVTIGIIWYGKEEPDEKFIVSKNTKVVKKQGPKWVLIRYALSEVYPEWKDEFDFIWLPDDDLKFVVGSIVQIADVMASFDLDLAQPCLTDKNITSIAYRPLVLRSRNPRAVFHRTNFVEIMCPMFSRAGLKQVFSSTIDTDACRSGWGLDSVWPKLLHEDSVGVIDIVQVEHTRPPNSFASVSTTASYENIDPRREELDLLAKFRVPPFTKRVLQVVED